MGFVLAVKAGVLTDCDERLEHDTMLIGAMLAPVSPLSFCSVSLSDALSYECVSSRDRAFKPLSATLSAP